MVRCGNQRYCPTCAAPAVAEIDSAQGLAYYETNKAVLNPARNERRRQGPRCCAECGTIYTVCTRALTCGPECARARRNRLARERLQMDT